MADHKLKVRVGAHEFEAEGSQESVERQFQMWKELIVAAPAGPTLASPPPLTGQTLPPQGQTQGDGFEKLFRKEGLVVMLAVLPNGGDDRETNAALLVLLGQKLLVGEDQITGTRLMQGLNRSGINVERVDRMFGDIMGQYVIRSGVRKAVRYRLTTLGLNRAQEIAKELLAMVP